MRTFLQDLALIGQMRQVASAANLRTILDILMPAAGLNQYGSLCVPLDAVGPFELEALKRQGYQVWVCDPTQRTQVLIIWDTTAPKQEFCGMILPALPNRNDLN